ncbi:MAG: hypothetical protein M0008_01795 [Actinomycetota bacterium]|nr:hypothetical protein [Actinomycetota bacterium]
MLIPTRLGEHTALPRAVYSNAEAISILQSAYLRLHSPLSLTIYGNLLHCRVQLGKADDPEHLTSDRYQFRYFYPVDQFHQFGRGRPVPASVVVNNGYEVGTPEHGKHYWAVLTEVLIGDMARNP